MVQEEQKVRELFEKHDSDSSDSLDEAQMKTFMEEYVHTIPEYAEKHVSDEEVKYVMAIADSLGDGAVEAEEITEAVAVWQSLLGDQDKIAARFDVYDTDKSGDLDKGQVALVLKDLNGGAEVGDEEVDWVMNSADGKGPLKLGAPLCPLCRQPAAQLPPPTASEQSPANAAAPLTLHVVRAADGKLNKNELKVAVAVWYTHVTEKKTQKSSSACTIL